MQNCIADGRVTALGRHRLFTARLRFDNKSTDAAGEP